MRMKCSKEHTEREIELYLKHIMYLIVSYFM